ncbi:hypothetical protein GCM10007877_12800 [Marinibactrum halimedae]|uniref:Uncharacterized protein n=2 Tax=Marinibactrum halimedae TaxID=1444977 RepID=A0AA37WMV8_9GAMM|nr:hypothetical protein GCM10007877_12800 [Marinibactrum halimedae]
MPAMVLAASPQEFQLHGFAAISYLHSDDNNFFGDSENGSFEFYELGLNGLWEPHKRFHFATQAVARDAGETDDGNIRIDFAFANIKLLIDEHYETSVRLGRVVNPYGFYNDTRDVAATRPSILLPQSVYFDVNRNLALSSDGAHLIHQHRLEKSDITFQIGVFEPRTEDPDLEPATFFQSVPGEFEGARSWMARLNYDYDFGRFRAALTAADIELDYKPSRDDLLSPGFLDLRPLIFSVQYQQEQWTLTAEYVIRKTALKDFGPPLEGDIEGHNFFIQGEYRLSNKWRWFLRYDELVWNNDDPKGEDFEAATGIQGHIRYAKDWTLGTRWDFNQHYMVSAEIHSIEGTGWLSILENPLTEPTDKDWSLFAVTFSARF